MVTAAPLDAATQAACTEMLATALGDMPSSVSASIRRLIAGVELRGAHARLQNNWRADLDRIARGAEPG